MEDSPPTAGIPRKFWLDRIQAVFEILLVCGLVSGLIASLPLPLLRIRNADFLLKNTHALSLYLLLESAITFLLLTVIMGWHRESIASLGLSWKSWKRNCILGFALVPFLFLANAVVAVLFKLYLPQYYSDHNPLVENIRTPQQLALFVFAALVAGGIKEEVQRAFILNRFRSHLGGAWAGLVIWSLAFGAGHYIQGAQGTVIASLYGFTFGLLYLLSGSLIGPIAAHAAYDTIAILAYWFISGRGT